MGAKEWFPPFRDLNSRNSPSWGDCSFSVDLTADLFSATAEIGGSSPSKKATRKNALFYNKTDGSKNPSVLLYLFSFKQYTDTGRY